MHKGHTAVIVQDLTSARTATVFRTQATRAGRVVGPSGRLYPLGISDMFCVVDWSRDSQRLLVRALIVRRESDNTFVDVWIYDVQSKRRRLVPQSALRGAIVRHWIRKGADFRDVYYWLDVAGWEDSTVPRLVFTATVLEGRPESFPAEFDGFLGAWSINLSGGGNNTPHRRSYRHLREA